MRYLDLTKLLGGQSFTTRVTLTKNGLSYKLPALLDSGANGYCFIDRTLLKSLSFFLKPSIHRLPNAIPVKGFNGVDSERISHYTTLNLTVDKRLQAFTPFLITRLGNHGVILGRTWLEEHRVLLDAARRRIIWPKTSVPTATYSSPVEIKDLRQHKVQQRYQRDAERRDLKLNQFWKELDERRVAGVESHYINTLSPRQPSSFKQRKITTLFRVPIVDVRNKSRTTTIVSEPGVSHVDLDDSSSIDSAIPPAFPPKSTSFLTAVDQPSAVDKHTILPTPNGSTKSSKWHHTTSFRSNTAPNAMYASPNRVITPPDQHTSFLPSSSSQGYIKALSPDGSDQTTRNYHLLSPSGRGDPMKRCRSMEASPATSLLRLATSGSTLMIQNPSKPVPRASAYAVSAGEATVVTPKTVVDSPGNSEATSMGRYTTALPRLNRRQLDNHSTKKTPSILSAVVRGNEPRHASASIDRLPSSLCDAVEPPPKTGEVDIYIQPLVSSILFPPSKEKSPRVNDLFTSATRTTHAKHYAASLRQMNSQLNGTTESFKNDSSVRFPVGTKHLQTQHLHNHGWRATLGQRENMAVRMHEISAPAFRLLARRKSDDEIFVATLHEIDSLIRQGKEKDERTAAISTLTVELTARRQTARQFAACINELESEPPIPEEYASYARAFSKAESDTLPPHRPYDHKIELGDSGASKLKYSPLYRMSTEELEVVKAYITDNLAKGFIEPSQAPFAAPVLFVKKPNGSLRFCIDFRVLNSLTRKDRYPLPLIDETLARIANAKIFTKLDIRQAFHRIRMDPASEEYTTFRTRYGAYKCKVLPFGLTNGPATYQRYMNDILFDYLDDFCTAYLDDILIYSEDPLEHQTHVRKVLQRLEDAGLQADLKKCEFSVTRTKYLGFIISTSGLEVDPEKVSVVSSWTYPGSVKGVQSFLGFCNFYRRFIKDYGIIAKPLVHLTKNNVPFRFNRECEDAFDLLKHTLTSAPLLRHYQQGLPCMLETDASDGVVAGVLSQKHGEDWFPVAYFSKTMLPAELNYAVHDKEMLAIIRSFGQWRAELAGTPHQVRVVTDHKALEYFMTSKQLNARQARWAELLADYNFMITYRPGTQNPLADALSRRPEELDVQNSTKKAQRLQQLLSEEQVDPTLLSRNLRDHSDADVIVPEAEIADLSPTFSVVHQALEANRAAPSLQALRKQALSDKPGKLSMQGDLLLYDRRLVVPDVEHIRTLLIREVHDRIETAHPSARKTYQLLSSQYWWHGIASTAQQYCRNCHTCRRIQVPRDKKPGFLQPLPVPSRPWEHITVDYCSFNKDKHEFDNVLVFIDRFSKQAVSIPCRKTSDARDLAKLYIYHVYRYFGPPLTITSDRGPQFISRFWTAFVNITGTKRQLSTADHPQTDGQTEVYNQYLQRRLRPFVSHYQDDWSEFLPMMDYAQMTLPHDSLGGLSPFEVVHGYAPRQDWDWNVNLPDSASPADKLNAQQAVEYARRQHAAFNTARSHILNSQARMARSYNKSRREIDFDVDDLVWLDMRYFTTTRPSKKLDFPTNGPFRVVEKIGSSYRLELPASMKVHNVFPAAKLRKDPGDPLPGQFLEPPPPINVTGDDEWEIEDILACRKQRGNLSYRVSWLNQDVDLTWYPASDVKYAPAKLREFHINNPTQAGPPANLLKWLEAYQEGVEDYDDLDNDREMDNRSRTSFFRRGG